MAVVETQRGRGVGRALVAAAIERAAAMSAIEVLRVATGAADTGNLRFYQRLGFRMRSIERDAFTPANGYPPGSRSTASSCATGSGSTSGSMPADLYLTGSATLLASFEAYARGADGAAVIRAAGCRRRGLPRPARARGLQQRAARPRPRGERARRGDRGDGGRVRRGRRGPLRRLGARDRRARCAPTSRRAATRSTPPPARWGWRSTTSASRLPEVELDAPEWPAYVAWLESVGVPPGLLAGADPREFHLLIARGRAVATALAFDFGDDCGIYNVGTLEHARRRGLGTALTARLLHDARARGRRTASLQATGDGRAPVHRARLPDLGRILEFVPS